MRPGPLDGQFTAPVEEGNKRDQVDSELIQEASSFCPGVLMLIHGSVSKPCTPGEPQNSWDLWMFIPLKMVCIGIDPYSHVDAEYC